MSAHTEIEASSFRTIWRVLRALAAHDARVVGRITELRASRSQGAAYTTTTGPAEGEAAGAGEGEQPAAPVESPIEWLRVDARQHAARILQTVKLRAFNPRAVEWQRMHAVAAGFHIEHGHLTPLVRGAMWLRWSGHDGVRTLHHGAGLARGWTERDVDSLDGWVALVEGRVVLGARSGGAPEPVVHAEAWQAGATPHAALAQHPADALHDEDEDDGDEATARSTGCSAASDTGSVAGRPG
ncbi:hypothetical protein [Kitasatospora sp. NPDC001225]